ncbi:MAG: hypothetical protein RSC68_05080 [Acinetobacter sp.]
MNNLALRVFWTNSPMPVNQKIANPDVVLNVPFGNILIVNTGGGAAPVRSVNTKTGHVVLTAEDVGADPIGSANFVKTQLQDQINTVKTLAETNQLRLTTKVDQHDFDLTKVEVENNRVALLNKADLTALAMLTALIDTKADQVYVQEQIANLVNGDQSIINAIQEISSALHDNEDLLEALDYTVANRVRFDIATQALTALQKSNARANIGAEEVGTAALLVAQITVQSIGAATAAQGAKAQTALQSADVAPVALSGLFSSLAGQNKIFDVVYSAYVDGANSVITATDSLGVMLGKLQAQIKNNSSGWNWVNITQIGTMFDTSSNYQFAQEHFINGVGGVWFCIKDNMLYMKALFKVIGNVNGTGQRLFTITDLAYKPKFGASNLFVVRSSAGSIDDLSGAGLNQLIFSYRNGTTYMYFSSQQSLSNGGVYMIPATAIGFI